MAQDPRFITTVNLEPYFVDKSTGAPLSGGFVSFFEDLNRTVPKLVYEISGAPPNYTFTPLPNPIQLSSVGTLQDAAGNNIAVYYFPFDTAGNVQQYYIVVTDALGTEQFTREAWPDQAIINSGTIINNQVNITNQLSNSQFAEVLFTTPTLSVPYTGVGTTTFEVAANWTLNIAHTGAGTLTITQNSITGIAALPGNPPYTLTVTPGANITGLTLVQQLTHNPDIWSPAVGGVNGWLASTILLAPGSSVSMQYAPSVGPAQTVLTANNLTGVYTQFKNTVQLAPCSNTDNSNVGFVNIVITLPTGAPTEFSNVQVIGLETNIQNIPFAQIPFVVQEGQKFSFFLDDLLFKPIASQLIGWDFPMNPAQPLGFTVAAFATGANTSNYVWDQTIVFQTTNSGPSFSRAPSGAFRVTANAATQVAVIQYLNGKVVNEILNRRNSVNIEALTNVVAGVGAKISLWYTTGGLPNMGANQSLVATLDATGKPATFNGTWLEVPRSNLGDAALTIGTSTTTNFNAYGFSGWDLSGIAAVNTAANFAIVVGTQTIPMGNFIDFQSISLVPGNIPTIPAPQSRSAVLAECGRFFTMSFTQGVVPAVGTGNPAGLTDAVAFHYPVTIPTDIRTPSFQYPYQLRTGPSLTIFNPFNADNFIYNLTNNASFVTTTVQLQGDTRSVLAGTSDAGAALGNFCLFHYTADARLGIV